MRVEPDQGGCQLPALPTHGVGGPEPVSKPARPRERCSSVCMFCLPSGCKSSLSAQLPGGERQRRPHCHTSHCQATQVNWNLGERGKGENGSLGKAKMPQMQTERESLSKCSLGQEKVWQGFACHSPSQDQNVNVQRERNCRPPSVGMSSPLLPSSSSPAPSQSIEEES